VNDRDRSGAPGKGRLARAATGVLNLGVAGAAAAGAALLHSWPMLAAGGVTYAALVAWDLVRPSKPAAPAGLGDASSYRDSGIRSAVGTIQAARADFDRVLAETPEQVKATLAGATLRVDDWMTRAADLAGRGEMLSTYLARKDRSIVEQDVRALEARVAAATDPAARAQYTAALNARQEHARVLQELSNARERVIASLLTIASSLETLGGKVVVLRTLDATAMDQVTGDVNDEIARVDDEIRTLEESLQALGDKAA
jgi:hypothetical protein